MTLTIILGTTTALATGGLIYTSIRLRVTTYFVRRANLRVSHWRGKALAAQCQLDAIHQQHVDAGHAAHMKFKLKRAETTEALRQCVAARSNETPAPDQQRRKRAERVGMPRSHRQGAAGAPPPAWLAKGDSIDPECRLAKPRGVIPPLLTSTIEGAI